MTIPDEKINLAGNIKYFDLKEWKNLSDDKMDINYLGYLNKVNLNFGTFKKMI